MNKFDNHYGIMCKVDFRKQCISNYHQYGEVIATIDFQCRENAGIPGLVYVKFKPKGKRKEISLKVHQDDIELI